jgi:predicted NAD-dependent protein-ADP-ribosyltransferase YbiA (DUF1768 family)
MEMSPTNTSLAANRHMTTLNVYSRSEDWRGRTLSNFSDHPFILNGQRFANVEGFIQGIAFPEGDTRRDWAFQAEGREAKSLEDAAEKKNAWWNGKRIPFGSRDHHKVIEQAIREKFRQNPDAQEALLATQGLTLVHILPTPDPPDTCLPASIFCEILMRVRNDLCRRHSSGHRSEENHPQPIRG